MPEPPNYDAPALSPGATPVFSGPDARPTSFDAGVYVSPAYIWLTEALTKWLRYHFASASRIEFPQLKARVWTAADSSPILITSLAEWKPTMSSHRPAVLIDRMDQNKSMKLRGIGDQRQGVRQGYFADFIEGSHVVHCLGGQDGEAEILAAEVWRELHRFAPVAREAYCLTQLLPMQIGRRAQLSDTHKDIYTVPITLVYTYSQAWRLRPLDEEEIMLIRPSFGFPTVL